MTAAQMWAEYQQDFPDAVEYDAFCFGADADELAALVLLGVKTATASAYPLYEAEGEPLPSVGAYSVVLNSLEEAVCIIRNTKVYVTPFEAVNAHHAYCEGEGDRSLAYWRKVHEAFFVGEMAECGLEFDESMPVVCEEFEVVYPK